jgi:hypothetical protein
MHTNCIPGDYTAVTHFFQFERKRERKETALMKNARIKLLDIILAMVIAGSFWPPVEHFGKYWESLAGLLVCEEESVYFKRPDYKSGPTSVHKAVAISNFQEYRILPVGKLSYETGPCAWLLGIGPDGRRIYVNNMEVPAQFSQLAGIFKRHEGNPAVSKRCTAFMACSFFNVIIPFRRQCSIGHWEMDAFGS